MPPTSKKRGGSSSGKNKNPAAPVAAPSNPDIGKSKTSSKKKERASLSAVNKKWVSVWQSRLRDRATLQGNVSQGNVLQAKARTSKKMDVANIADELANITIEGTVDEDDEITLTEEHGLEMASDVLECEEMYQIEELEGARDAVKTLTTKRQILKDFRDKNPKIEDVEAISFSKLTQKHMDRLGVIQWTGTHSGDWKKEVEEALKVDVFKAGVLSEKFRLFWENLTKNTDFLKLFNAILVTVGERPEARARLLTDQIILRVLNFLRDDLHLLPFLFLEYILSSFSDLKPVVISHKNQATFLTGSVDYAVITLTDKQNEFEDFVGKLMKQSNLEETLQENAKLAAEFKDMNRFKVTTIEEKRKEYSLEQWEPQAIGEGLAIMERTGRDSVPWCISNGEEWLFGLVTKADKEKTSYRLPILSLRKDEFLEVELEDMEMLFKLLIIWTAIPDISIKRRFFKKHNV